LLSQAGNNEDYQVAESLKLELDYSDENPENFRKTNFPAFVQLSLSYFSPLSPLAKPKAHSDPLLAPAFLSSRYIYEKTLPDAVNSLSSIHYHRGSPYGGKDTTDRTVGDLHQWNVWHGTQEPWTNWDKLSGRFVSEFGMEGEFEHLASLLSRQTDLFPSTSCFTQGSPTSERSIGFSMETRKSDTLNLEPFVVTTKPTVMSEG